MMKLLQRYFHFVGASLSDIVQSLTMLAQNPEQLEEVSKPLAQSMVRQVQVQNARSWREAARKSNRGREIYLALRQEMHGTVGNRVQELIEENAKLIGSVPSKVAFSLSKEIARLQQQGMRHDAIADYIRKRVPKLTRSRVALIARTESSKAATALTQARAEEMNLKWYQWSTSHDERVRASHRLMSDVLVAWNDPPSPERLAHEPKSPSPYNVGDIYNCRCVGLPLVSLDFVSWPARVYRHGRIQRMTRAQFAALAGMEKVA
jgi:SPP1 gp7 family putative phage head morphogenesis protein